jgi:hypothetical protein
MKVVVHVLADWWSVGVSWVRQPVGGESLVAARGQKQDHSAEAVAE